MRGSPFLGRKTNLTWSFVARPEPGLQRASGVIQSKTGEGPPRSSDRGLRSSAAGASTATAFSRGGRSARTTYCH